MAKTLSIKIPISIAQQMDDRGQLNPIWVARFLEEFYEADISDQPLEGLYYTYVFKIDGELRKAVKDMAKYHGLPMTEFVGRLLVECYDYA